MLKAKLLSHSGNRECLVIGLVDEEIEILKTGSPMYIDLDNLGDDMSKVCTVLLMAGPSEQNLINTLNTLVKTDKPS